jgi:carboxypeptidase family protein
VARTGAVHPLAKVTILEAVLLMAGTLAQGQTFGATGVHGMALPTEQCFHCSSPQSRPEHKTDGPQTLGIIRGTILDQTGAVSVGARVRLAGKGRSLSQEVVAGENGQFSFSNIPPGSFQLTITGPGFATQIFSGDLRAGQTFLVPAIVLPVATAETEVRVGVPSVEVAQEQIKEQQKQRVLAIFPNFYVSYVPDAAPLNAKQKFELASRVAVDPVTIVGVGALAGIQQAGNDIPGFGQGAEGFAKRYGAAYANALTGIFVGNAILPSLLKQDPRYFYKGTGSTKSRVFYALASSVICKGDNKRWQPNYSGILGSLAVGGVSNLYYPASDRNGAGVVFKNTLIRIGEGSIGGILQEFVVKGLTPHLRHHQPIQP